MLLLISPSSIYNQALLNLSTEQVLHLTSSSRSLIVAFFVDIMAIFANFPASFLYSTLNKSAVPVTSSSQHLKGSALSSLYSNRIVTVVASFGRYYLPLFSEAFDTVHVVFKLDKFIRSRQKHKRDAIHVTSIANKNVRTASPCSLRSFAPYICSFLTFLSLSNAAFCLLSFPSFFVIRNY